jgi:hypothetical protein
MRQIVRHRELRYLHEVDSHECRDVGDREGFARDKRPALELAIEELQELRDAWFVGLSRRRRKASSRPPSLSR